VTELYRSARSVSAQRVGVAVVGCGEIAKAHLSALRRLETARLRATVDVDAERAKRAAEASGAEVYYAGVEDALGDPAVDACILCLPHHLHKPVALQAARAGKHVLVEKPMALSLDEALEMVAAAEEHGVRLMVGHVLRFRAHNRKVYELLRSGAIGEPLSFVRRRYLYSRSLERAPWAADPARSGGRLLYDLGPHEYDLLLWLAGSRAKRVFALGRVNNPAWQSPDEILSVIELDGGSIASVTLSLNSHTGVWDQFVFGTEGSIFADNRTIVLNGQEVAPGAGAGNGILSEDAEFIAAILEGREPEASGRNVLRTMALLDAVRASMTSGQEVQVVQVGD